MRYIILVIILIELFSSTHGVYTFANPEPRTITLEWIKDQLSYIRERLPIGISQNELEILKTYLVGFGEEESAALEKEIDELLSSDENFDFGSGNPFYGPTSGSDFSESEPPLESPIGNIPHLESVEKAESPVLENYPSDSFENFENKYFHKPDHSNHKGKPHRQPRNDECGGGTSSLILRQTAVIPSLSTIFNTEDSATKTITGTLTTTKIIKMPIFLEETEIVQEKPRISTMTTFVTQTIIRNVDTILPVTDWSTEVVYLTATQLDTTHSYHILKTKSPAYVTFTLTELVTTASPVTTTHVVASTMVVTHTKYHEIPFTVTKSKEANVHKVLTETIFEKKMITKKTEVEAVETKVMDCNTGFFGSLKKPWLG